jgi:hypothetical protein
MAAPTHTSLLPRAPEPVPGPASARWWRDVVVGGAEVLVAVAAAPLLRRRYARWGTVPSELTASLPGDELVPAPRLSSTRAITVDAPADEVWPWLVQIGQGRGGLYSFDGLEDLLGCHISSADAVRPELQDLRVGDEVRLHPAEGTPAYRVQRVEAPTTLVLVGGDDGTRITWQFVLRPMYGGRRTRLLARQRWTYRRRQSVLWHLVEPVGFVMERRMLRGLARRAEGRPG